MMPRRFFWTTFGMGVVAIVTIVALLLWFSTQTDKSVQDELRQRVVTSLELQRDNLGTVVTDYAYWTAAWEWYTSGDEAMLYDSMGSGASESDTFDMMAFLAPDGTPTHGYVTDITESDLAALPPSLADPILPAMRAAPLLPYATTAGITLIDGRPALIAGGRIQPDDVEGLGPDDLPYMIGVTFLDLDVLGAVLALEDMTFAPPGGPVRPGRSVLPLTGVDGAEVGALKWPTPRPGQDLLTRTAPVVGLLFLVLLGGSWVVAHMAMQQAQSHMREWLSARSDPVTGLLNRAGLGELIGTPPVQAALARGEAAVIYVDLNGIKALNDSFGHQVGDAAIEVTAERLQAALRKGDHVARVGGDEFVCLILDRDPLLAASAIAARFSTLNEAPFGPAGRTHRTSAAIGIAVATPGLAWDTLLNRADTAMYRAKRLHSRDAVVFSEPLSAAG